MIDNIAKEQIGIAVEELVRKHISSSDQIPLDADLMNDLGMDSLELVELGLKLEKMYGVKFGISDIRGCVTLEDLIQLVASATSVQE